MKSKVEKNLLIFSNKKHLLSNYLIGLEKESLRVLENGSLSSKPHPQKLGSKLLHPYINTDFGEAQLEYKTPPMKTYKRAEKFLMELHQFTDMILPSEVHWPLSMPGILPEEKNIQIAEYGSSPDGKEKEIYRKGLTYRYGTKMQMISGLHYNFSFIKPFWEVYFHALETKGSLQDFISSSYMKLSRAFLCHGWLLTYLFGASPFLHKSYLKEDSNLNSYDPETLYGKFATSLRMSSLGYYSRVQEQLSISFNTLEDYLHDLKQATSTPKKEYEKFGNKWDQNPKQLNANILQITNEHYSRIRPKCSKGGVEYLEIRAIDLNPYYPLGIQDEQLKFLHMFMLFCLFTKNTLIDEKIAQTILQNQDSVALFGRDPSLLLEKDNQKIPMQKWALEILDHMEPIAACLGTSFIKTLDLQKQKIMHPKLTPSSILMEGLHKSKQSAQNFSMHIAKEHKANFFSKPLPPNKQKILKKLTEKSLEDQKILEKKRAFILKDHEDLELSTQIVIREAHKRGVLVEILDRKENFIRLTKGPLTEYVKQATKTSKDSYISAHIMGNKQITKQILKEHGLQVPQGGSYQNIEEAISDYPKYSHCKSVIKPNTTNYGLGIDFCNPGEKTHFQKCIKHAFLHDSSILIEEFVEGEEYRFLVIGKKMIGVLKRDPANVIGDGKNTIQKLIQDKNTDPNSYKQPKEHIRLSKIEKAFLKQKNRTPKTTPHIGQKIYLRTNSNISTGGDPIDMTEEIHETYKEIALKASKSVSAFICGVDIIIKEPKRPATKQNHSIIELNYNPMLSMHSFPYRGKPRDTGKAMLDFLGFPP